MQGIDLFIDLRSHDSGNNNNSTGGSISPTKEAQSHDTVVAETQLQKECQGQNQILKVKKAKGRGLKPKPGIRKIKWNLENEIAKAIERGVARGIDFKKRKPRSLSGSDNAEVGGKQNPEREFEEEVTKILETGAALGFDFIGKEVKISQILKKAKGALKYFDNLRNEHGCAQLISLDELNDPSNGYLVNDCCVFGVEVFVIQPSSGNEETLTMLKEPNGRTYT
ncbi:hypothetical protein LWI29_015550 [Acer saccharum]|uniref:MATH domain-containing protein n=1 Tax=Acer saccharum TaxID=4024 RepID=A0AA39SSL1_ACESA|nr:hypothetical protein LWI29_015550 [Acer saccharum]